MRVGARRVVVEETGAGPDPDQARRLANALRAAGADRLVGVSLEADPGTDPHVVLEPTAAALRGFAWARAGLRYALLPAAGLDWLVLCTSDDDLLLAGPPTLVAAYAPDPATLARELCELVGAAGGWRGPRLAPVLRHLDAMERASGGDARR